MIKIVSNITNIESNFENIYRITTENGLIIDIFEDNINNSKIEYIVENDINTAYSNTEYTIMNGIIYERNNNVIYVSFGGLLASIPLCDGINFENNIIFKYKLI